MKNNNKIILLMLIISLLLLIAGYIILGSQDNSSDNYSTALFSINMPIDNDSEITSNILEDLTNVLENNNIGYITGNGPIYFQGINKSYEIYLSILKNKIDEFEKYIEKYEIPLGSFLEVQNKKTKEYGKLYGFRISYKYKQAEYSNIDTDITNLLGEDLKYKVYYVFNDHKYIYYYGYDKKILEITIRDYIADKNLSDYINITSTFDK